MCLFVFFWGGGYLLQRMCLVMKTIITTFLSDNASYKFRKSVRCLDVSSLQDRRIGELGQKMTWARDRAREGGGNQKFQFSPPSLARPRAHVISSPAPQFTCPAD